jgi:hypothetical protein
MRNIPEYLSLDGLQMSAHVSVRHGVHYVCDKIPRYERISRRIRMESISSLSSQESEP